VTSHDRSQFVPRAPLLAALALVGGNAMSLEKPAYKVLYTDGDIEYRQYEPYLVSETVVQTTNGYSDAGNEGFRRLFNYISGDNASQAKIDMTAPVERMPSSEEIAMIAPVEQDAAAEAWRVTFMLPTDFTLENAPVPTDDRVRIREVPGRLMAVLKYSGRWTERNLAKRSEQLLDSVAAASIDRIGEVISAAYDPPFMPPFMRRNEVMVEVDGLPEASSGK
jgi:hypothetical protein